MNDVKTQDAAVSLLLEKIETQLGRKMMTPKDFDFLAEQIFVKTRQSISVSTLKRVWGYVSSKGDTRESTLNLLSKFAGYDSFSHFYQQEFGSTLKGNLPFRVKLVGGLIITLIVIAVLFSFVFKPFGSSDRPVLRCGQTFASYEEFLSLFNIKATDNQYYQIVPECSVAYVWAPQYNHPTYHNEGNPDSLMPTIAEYLSLKPLDDSQESRELLIEENRKSYHTAIRNNHVRLVFMKNLPGDTCFTFTGVYRVSFALSDTTKVIWTRVSQKCDLNNLEDLARLRK